MTDKGDDKRHTERPAPSTPAEGKPPEARKRPKKRGRLGYLEDFLPAD